jgi:iron complex outermembrane receptor protein
VTSGGQKSNGVRSGSVAFGVLSIHLASVAAAQVAGPESGGAGDAQAAPETIVVTGSRIRGVSAAATGSNVIAIDRSVIEETPVQSTADLLRRTPQVVTLGANPNGGLAQNGAANVTRSSGINLRGLGNTATLLLHDGRRFAPQGTQAQLTDPSVIPTIAVDRVEVVADGASAIYGSDAVAGVVNFILRKNFDGFEFSGRSGLAEHGDYTEHKAAAIYGKRWSGGWGMLAGEYTRSDDLKGEDFSWFQRDNRARGGRDLRTNFCDPGTLTVGGTTYAIPKGGVTPANVGDLVPGTSNLCFYDGEEDVLIPEVERKSVLGAVSQEVGDNVRLFADFFYSRKEGDIPRVATVTANVPNTNPFFVSPDPAATTVRVTWSPFPQYGALMNPYHGYSWNVSGGAEVSLPGDLRATAYYSRGESKEVMNRTKNGVNAAALNAALADPDPATALNVFGGPNNPATLNKLVDSLFVITGATQLDVANVQLDGSLFDLSGGASRFAVGGEYRREYTFTDLARGSSTAVEHDTADGARNVKALFAELFFPFVGSGNARAGLEELSLSLAGRWERYSDFGETTNPKVGVLYRPVEAVQLRASYGKSFRAPGFTEVSDKGGGSGLYYGTGAGANGNLSGISIGGGNPDLKPETATTWSFGVEVRPVDDLLLSLTYFDIDYKNQIQALTGTPGLLTNPLYARFVNLNPTQEQIDALRNSGLAIVDPGVLTGVVQYIADTRRQNLGRSLVSGLDFVAAYRWRWGGALLDAGLSGSYLTRYDFEPVQGAGFTDVLNTINFPQRFKVQADIGASFGRLNGRLTLNHLSSYRNTSVTPAQKVDLHLGAELTDNVSVSLEVRNLLDEDPPFVDSTFGYDPQSTNPLPRLFYLGAKLKF